MALDSEFDRKFEKYKKDLEDKKHLNECLPEAAEDALAEDDDPGDDGGTPKGGPGH